MFIRTKHLCRSSARWIQSTRSHLVYLRFIVMLSYYLHLLLPKRFLFFLFLSSDFTRILLYLPYAPLTPFECRGQERVQLYLYSPYGPYGLYRASVPVQRCTLLTSSHMCHIPRFLVPPDLITRVISGEK